MAIRKYLKYFQKGKIMEQITIKVIVSEKNGNWKVSIGKGRPRKKKNAVAIFRHVERFLTRKYLTNSASEVEDEIKVLVDYSTTHHLKPMSWTSDGICAGENEALYWLASNLEDYLPNRYLNMKYKLYEKEEN